MKFSFRLLAPIVLAVLALVSSPAHAAPGYYQPTASIAGLKAYGAGSPGILHAVVPGMGNYDWKASCPGTPDDARYVAAAGVGSGCWTIAGATGPYSGQVPQTANSLSNSNCLNIFTYLTPANQAAVQAGTSTVDFSQILDYAVTALSVNPVVAVGTYNGTNEVCLPPGAYHMHSAYDVKHTVHIHGSGGAGGLSGAIGTSIIFDAGIDGFIIDKPNTLGHGIVSPATTGADGTTFSDLAISNLATTWTPGTDPTNHCAIWERARANLTRVNINWHGGCGVKILASVGGGPDTIGNANEWRMDSVTIVADTFGMYTAGSDANGGLASGVGVSAGLACFNEQSSFGNKYDAPHADACGDAGLGRVTYLGHNYALISGATPWTDGGATTPGTDNGIWYDLGAGSGYPTWVSGHQYYASGSFIQNGGSTTSVYDGAYIEVSNPISNAPGPAMVIGGLPYTWTSWTPQLTSYTGLGGAILSGRGVGGYGTNAALGWGSYYATAALPYAVVWASAVEGGFQQGFGAGDPTTLCLNYSGSSSNVDWCVTSPDSTNTFGRSAAVSDVMAIRKLACCGADPRIFSSGTAKPSTTGYAQGEPQFNLVPTATAPWAWHNIAKGSPDTWLSNYINARDDPATGIGYLPGAGSTVTQATSRTTGVTNSKVTGNIVVLPAAGSATPFTFAVTNAQVVATDTISVSVLKGSTDKYRCDASPAAGSFDLTCVDLTGTTTEGFTVNFNVIRGAISLLDLPRQPANDNEAATAAA